MQRTELSVQVGMSLGKVPAILLEPPNPRWLYVIAHGAGAGMRHPFLEMMADVRRSSAMNRASWTSI